MHHNPSNTDFNAVFSNILECTKGVPQFQSIVLSTAISNRPTISANMVSMYVRGKVVSGSSLIWFPLVLADSERDMPGFEQHQNY